MQNWQRSRVRLLTEQLCKSNNGRRNASPTIEKYEKAVGDGFPIPKRSVNAAHPPPVSSSSKTFLTDRSHRDPSLRSRMTRWEGRNVRKRRREGSRAEENAKNYIKSVGATCGRPRSYRSPPRIRLLPKSVIYRSLLLREKGDRLRWMSRV